MAAKTPIARPRSLAENMSAMMPLDVSQDQSGNPDTAREQGSLPRVGHGRTTERAGEEAHDEEYVERLGPAYSSVERCEGDVREHEHCAATKHLGTRRPQERAYDKAEDVDTGDWG